MAAVTKSRARKAIAAGKATFSFANITPQAGFPETGEKYRIHVEVSAQPKLTSITTHLDRSEAIRYAVYVAGHITLPAQAWMEKRPPWEQLRALAAYLESEAGEKVQS